MAEQKTWETLKWERRECDKKLERILNERHDLQQEIDRVSWWECRKRKFKKKLRLLDKKFAQVRREKWALGDAMLLQVDYKDQVDYSIQ